LQIALRGQGDIKAQMLEVFNRDRAIVGLPPVNADYEVDL
jgi:hypothetical protein